MTTTFLFGCTAVAMAGEDSFQSFFPKASEKRVFPTIDAASDFVQSANACMRTSVAKNTMKGGGARLIGPSVKDKYGDQVVVFHYTRAWNRNHLLDISKLTDTLEQQIVDATEVYSTFLVFQGDRQAVFVEYYLIPNWRFRGNGVYMNFTFEGNKYKADYPIGWGIDEIFRYLKKEID
jgi:hypothetical protein